MAVEFGTGKTVLILAIVAGCFAVLWPKLFYPMLQASVTPKSSVDSSQACCDVIFETDVNAINIIAEMCGSILHRYDDFDPKLKEAFQQGKLSKEVVDTCRNEVLGKCGIDITAFLIEKVRLGKSYKQILDEIRSFNGSLCLKENFGVAPGSLGAPHRMRLGVLNTPSHHRQERPPHLRPELLHPALRERGRAIPQSHIVPKILEKEGRPGPIPGMRPPMGGAGHVVPAPKGSGTMGIVMPIYTIGIVVFFMYTIMKVMFKKQGDTPDGFTEFNPDPEFRKVVFTDPYIDNRSQETYEEHAKQKTKCEIPPPRKPSEEGSTKLVVTAISGLLAEVDAHRDILEKRAGSETKTEQEDRPEEVPSNLESKTQLAETLTEPEELMCRGETPCVEKEVSRAFEPKTTSAANEEKQVDVELSHDGGDNGGAKVKVMGVEVTASCEKGQRWSRPSTPVLGFGSHSRSVTPIPPPTPEPQSIFLEGSLPYQSQLLVSDSEITPDESGDDPDAPVVLSGKMTLSLISLDAALAAEDEEQQQKEPILGSNLDEVQKLEELESALREETTETASPVGKEEEEELEGEEDEEEEVDEDVEDQEDVAQYPNHDDDDDTPTTANYTTASAAAEATGPEETAAEFSAMESIDPDDDQAEAEEDGDDDLEENEEEVWNGDVDSADEEEESEDENVAPVIPPNQQRQHQR